MSKLPMSDFQWLTDDEISKFDFETLDVEGGTGYILECDLKYPKKLHKSHNNLTLAPEFLEITNKHLSPYARSALIQSGCQEKYKDSKLICSFFDRKDYVVHAKTLKLYLALGMEIQKIKRVLSFKQEAFIAPYIKMCTLARKNSKNPFDVSQYKKLVS